MIEFIETIFINLFFLCLTVSLFIILNRLRRGPSLADRVIAADLFTALLISAIAVGAIYLDEPAYFDIALVLAVIGFLGTIVFARFIDSQGQQPRPQQEEGSRDDE